MKRTVSLALLFVWSAWSCGCRAGKESATTETPPPVDTVADEDSGWPREITNQGNTLVLYQPQVDEWKNFRELNWRMAFSLTPAGGQEVVGIATMQSNADIDNDSKMVSLTNLKVVDASFPSLDPESAAKMGQLVRTFLPPSVNISMFRLIASVSENNPPSEVPLKNDPPQIFVSYRPAILLEVDGPPVRTPIENTQLEYVLNTHWRLFFDKSQSAYFLLVGQQWLRSNDLRRSWSAAATLPKEMATLPGQSQWDDLKDVIPPPAADASAIVPAVFYSERHAEVILFDGQPAFAQIAGTQLKYAENVSGYVFLYAPTKHYYYLTAGRWFAARSLNGPWTFATPTLPEDFANIPADSPVGDVLASVPGTGEAKDAVLLAQVPTTMVVNPTAAAAQAKVTYSGEPQFKPIEGTSLSYAANTPDKVIKVGDVYYLCLQGVWFLSRTSQGPWETAPSVTQVIYTIPPSSPVYNVTYVTQTTTPSGDVRSSHTAGYLGAFVLGAAVGAIVANGTGYYYPPYVYYPPRYGYGYRYPPVYYGRPPTYGPIYATPYYNTRTGAYGVAQTAYGPYGSATRTASYNPYTGTSTRTVSGSTYYGSRSAGQAYNPYTGTYAATRQGSSPTAQWGSSVITRGNQAAYTQHRTTSQGTVGSIQSSNGARAVGANTIYGTGAAGRTASGDMYAGRDGNVYKNTGNGWQKYDNGNWKPVATPYSTAAQPRAQNSRMNPTTAQTGTSPRAQNYQQRPPKSQVTPSTAQSQPRQSYRPTNSAAAQNTAEQLRAQSYQQQRPTAANGPATTQPRPQSYQQQRPAAGNGQATTQSRPQGYQQQRPQTFNQQAGNNPLSGVQREAQNRQRGARESQRFQQGRSGGLGRRN